MSCILCKDDILSSGNVRPNVATFDCGHEFHLSCILKHAKENLIMSCPICNTVDLSRMNLGDDRQLAIQSLIDARRKIKPVKKSGLLSWFSDKTIPNMIKSGCSLQSMKIKGITPEDIIEERMNWQQLSDIYTTDALLTFGFRWHHMITMGFQPEGFKKLTWHQMTDILNLNAKDMLKTSISIRELADLNISVPHLRQLGFGWNELKQIGGTCETMRLLTSNLGDIKTYFNPSKPELEESGFNTDNIEKFAWKGDAPLRKSRVKYTKNGLSF
jgi:hypothetical protein